MLKPSDDGVPSPPNCPLECDADFESESEFGDGFRCGVTSNSSPWTEGAAEP